MYKKHSGMQIIVNISCGHSSADAYCKDKEDKEDVHYDGVACKEAAVLGRLHVQQHRKNGSRKGGTSVGSSLTESKADLAMFF